MDPQIIHSHFNMTVVAPRRRPYNIKGEAFAKHSQPRCDCICILLPWTTTPIPPGLNTCPNETENSYSKEDPCREQNFTGPQAGVVVCVEGSPFWSHDPQAQNKPKLMENFQSGAHTPIPQLAKMLTQLGVNNDLKL